MIGCAEDKTASSARYCPASEPVSSLHSMYGSDALRFELAVYTFT
jgi:hypothetical protein